MTDIVDRLREHDLDICPAWKDEADKTMWIDTADSLMSEAADDIMHLRRNRINESEVQKEISQFSLRTLIIVNLVLFILFAVLYMSGYYAFSTFFAMLTTLFATKIDYYFNFQKLFEDKREHSDL